MKRTFISIISLASLLGAVSYAQENANFANHETNNQKSDRWAVEIMNDIVVSQPNEGKNLPDAFMMIVFKGIDYNYRVSYFESGHPEHNFIKQKTFLDIDENGKSHLIRRKEWLKPRAKLSSEVGNYINQIKTASKYQDNNDSDIISCVDPPLVGAYVRENGVVTYYSIPNSCGNKTLWELRCNLDYGASCTKLNSEEIKAANTKRIQAQILNKHNN